MNQRGQVWVETAIYTLIAFVLIGAVLAFAKPKIDEMKDKMIVEQSINMLKEIDNTLRSIGIPGNQRVVDLTIKDGSLKIDGEEDKIIFEIESQYKYSEEGVEITNDNLKILTLKEGGIEKVKITANYGSDRNLTFDGKDQEKIITKSPTPFKLIIIRKESGEQNRIVIDLKIN